MKQISGPIWSRSRLLCQRSRPRGGYMSLFRCLTVLVLGLSAAGCIGGRLQGPVARLKNTRSTHFAWVAHRGSYVPTVAGPFEKDFERGWKVGFRQMASTGSGDVPAVPDRRYWSPDFQSPWGQQRIAAWQQGFEEGIGAAAGNQTGPVMLASANEPTYCPECEAAGEPTMELAAPNEDSPPPAFSPRDVTPREEQAQPPSRFENGHTGSESVRAPNIQPEVPFADEADDVPLPFEPEADVPPTTNDQEPRMPEPLESETTSPFDAPFEVPGDQPDEVEGNEFDGSENLRENLEDLFGPTSSRIDRLPLTRSKRDAGKTHNADGWNVSRRAYPASRDGKVRAEGADPTPVGIQSGSGVIRLVHRPSPDAHAAASATLGNTNVVGTDGNATHTSWQGDTVEKVLEPATSSSESPDFPVVSEPAAIRKDSPSRNSGGPEFPRLTFGGDGNGQATEVVSTRPVARAEDSNVKPPVILSEEFSSTESEPIPIQMNRTVFAAPIVSEAAPDTSELLRRLKALSGDGAEGPPAERDDAPATDARPVHPDDLFQDLQGAVDGP
jgi:hypothetical protein